MEGSVGHVQFESSYEAGWLFNDGGWSERNTAPKPNRFLLKKYVEWGQSPLARVTIQLLCKWNGFAWEGVS